ncbi:MAG: hypothetical protein HC806_04715, partial [Anaerolineae bacterium]|nr:hypothetical protein [Anaerolineae bacterium]
QAEIFNERLLALMEEFREMSPSEGEDSNVYGLTIVFNPVLESQLPSTNVKLGEPSSD